MSIALVSAQPAGAAAAAANAARQAMGIDPGEGTSTTLTAWLVGLVVLVLALAGVVGYLLWRYGMPSRARPERREPVSEGR